MKPMLMRSGLTDRLYIVTRYKDRGEGRYEAVTKYEVTDAELDACGLARSTAEPLDVERLARAIEIEDDRLPFLDGGIDSTASPRAVAEQIADRYARLSSPEPDR